MLCWTHFEYLYYTPNVVLTLAQIYNVLIGVLNITGNAILIWALGKTGQTESLSTQFIIVRSASDLTIGITALVFITMIFQQPYMKYCWMKLTTQILLSTCTYFSAIILFLMSLDRCLNVKYLERYSFIVTKKRGYLMIFMSFLLAVSSGILVLLPITLTLHHTLQSVYNSLLFLFLTSAIVLYYVAKITLRRKAHTITTSILNQHRAIGKAAKKLSLCTFALTTPIDIFLTISSLGIDFKVFGASVVNTGIWLGYITLLANGFCSSIILISKNALIKRTLRWSVRGNWNRIRSIVGTSDEIS